LIGDTIDGNLARTGGGVDHFNGQLSMINDTVTGNAASDNGGGLYNRDTATLTHVTFSGNTANGQGTGGNIFNDTASMAIKNSIVANSDASGNCFNSDGFINSQGHNIESGNSCGFTSVGDLVNTDPLFGPLQNNGGFTLTFALLPDSPAIDRGDNTGCPTTDQRGFSRPVDGNGDGIVACDMGAFEFNGVALTETTPPPSPIPPTKTAIPVPTNTSTPIVTDTPVGGPSPTITPVPPNTPCASAFVALIVLAYLFYFKYR
jgi:hypothetical protein